MYMIVILKTIYAITDDIIVDKQYVILETIHILRDTKELLFVQCKYQTKKSIQLFFLSCCGQDKPFMSVVILW